MKILLTGSEGYIGAILGPILVDRGHDVVGLDAGFYREGWLYTDAAAARVSPRVLNKDLRRVAGEDLVGVEAIVHLAELSNDPLGALKPDVTHQINHAGSVALAKLAKRHGVSRFVYASSCSVYGVGDGGHMSEISPVNPQTAYAECKLLVERDLTQLVDDDFSPVILRNATAYGASPRMRFDIVLNNLAGLAWTLKEIAMVSDGTPWRPLVHVEDICRAIVCALDAPREHIHGEIFNVGDNAENYRIREIAEIVGARFPGCTTSFGPSGGDNRSYRVSFDKIGERLPEFRCAWTADRGARQLRDLFERIGFTRETFEFRAFTRLNALKHLLATRQLDDALFWRRP